MFRWNKTIIEEFIYETEEEKNEHSKSMIKQGFEDTGQVKYDTNRSLNNPNYRWYGKYVKYEK